MARPTDPWHWSVDDVVDELCRSDGLWRNLPSARVPDPATFEPRLRDNDVNGSTLLTDVTGDVLRNDFGISSLGQRSATLWAINQLRDQSDAYLTEQRRSVTRQQSILGGAVAGVKRERNSIFPETPETSERLAPRTPPCQEILPELSTQPILDTNARANEFIIEGKNGTKRRKLNLPQPAAEAQTQGATPQLDASRVGALTAHNDSASRTSQYTGSKLLCGKVGIDSLFFGPTKMGRELLVDGKKTTPQDAYDPGEFDFSFVSAKATGERSFFGNRMRHFWSRAPRRMISRNGRDAIMIHPYPESAGGKQGRPAVILVERNGDRIVATKDDALHIAENMPHEGDTESSDNQWDFLLRWQNERGGDDIVAELSDTRSSQVSEGLRRELEEEEVGEDGVLAEDVVSTKIDETFEQYVEAWKIVDAHRDDRKAWRIWHKDSKRYSRQQRIGFAKAIIQSYDRRLRDHRAYILKDTYKTDKEVQKACVNSKLTVELREHEKFKIEVLKRVQPPTRPAGNAPERKAKPALADDGGIIIDSDSENDLHDFVEDDNPTGPIRPGDGSCSQSSKAATGADSNLRGPNPGDAMKLDELILGTNSNGDDAVQLTQRGGTVVDLGGSSQSSEGDDVPAPVMNSPQPPDQPSPSDKIYNHAQWINTIEEADVEKWSYDDVQEEGQRIRLLLKMILDLSPDEYQSLRCYILATDGSKIEQSVLQTLKALLDSQERIRGVALGSETERLFLLTKLFLSWQECCRDYLGTVGLDVVQKVLALEAIRDRTLIRSFRELLKVIFERFPDPKKASGAVVFEAAELEDLSEDELADESDEVHEMPPPKTPRKLVHMDGAAVMRRKKAQARQEATQRFTQHFLPSQSQDLIIDESGPMILVNEEEDESKQVFVHPKIAGNMQGHQVEGLRFIWREIVAGEEGCLLAHTMGLGKTMQTIAFLLSLAESVQNPDIDLPIHLRRFRVLILCPGSLINNWKDELHKWVPQDATHKLVGTFAFSKIVTPKTRLEIAKTWADTGGILLVGYELFARIVGEDAKPSGNMSLVDHTELVRLLLESPQLVVADEAHKMKNLKSKLWAATTRIKTKSRVALTGSPLANNLMEYFALIDWVSPGYLGDADEFRGTYKNPIEEGLYTDSTPYKHRKSLKKLQQLVREIDPKVNRASISVLKGKLQPKVEFVLMLGLTEFQKALYSAIVHGLQGADAEASNAKLWNWLRLLVLVCNHPYAFQKKLLEKSKPTNAKSKQAAQKKRTSASPDEDLDELGPDSIPLANSGLSPESIEKLKKMLAHAPELISMDNSVKSRIFTAIVKQAHKVKDRVLVFSHSLLTLDYLEEVLKKEGKDYLRLDGKVPPEARQDLANRFNAGTQPVFLISTCAGGTGFNLPGANRVIIFDFRFNPTWEEQAIGRAYRLGQQKPVFVYRFVAGGTFEDAVYQKAVFKTQLAYRTIERKNIGRQARKTSDFLFEPRHIDCEDLDEYRGKDVEVLDKLLGPDFVEEFGDPYPIRSIQLSETLQREAEEEQLTPEEEQEVQEELDREKLRREKPDEYYRKYGFAHAHPVYSVNQVSSSASGGQQPVWTDRAPFQHQEHQGQPGSVSASQPVSMGQIKEDKVAEVLAMTQCADKSYVQRVLATCAWSVPSAAEKVRDFMQSSASSNGSARLNSAVDYGRAALPPIVIGSTTASKQTTAVEQVDGAMETSGANRRYAIEPDTTLSPAITYSESIPKRTEQDEALQSSFSPQQDRSDTALSDPSSTALPAPATNVKKEKRTPLSTAPSAKTNDGVIDLTVSDGDDELLAPTPRPTPRKIKRMNFSAAPNQSDGAFDRQPKGAKGSLPAIYQSDGMHDILLGSTKEPGTEAPPRPSQGFKVPPKLGPAPWERRKKYARTSIDDSSVFDLGHVSEESSTDSSD